MPKNLTEKQKAQAYKILNTLIKRFGGIKGVLIIAGKGNRVEHVHSASDTKSNAANSQDVREIIKNGYEVVVDSIAQSLSDKQSEQYIQRRKNVVTNTVRRPK